MRPATTHRFCAGVNDVGGSIEIGLADLQMDNILALSFECAGAHQHFEGGLRAQPRHPASQSQLSLRGLAHSKAALYRKV